MFRLFSLVQLYLQCLLTALFFLVFFKIIISFIVIILVLYILFCQIYNLYSLLFVLLYNFVFLVIECFKKIFMHYFTIINIIVYHTTIILNTLNKVANCMKLRIVKSWLTWLKFD